MKIFVVFLLLEAVIAYHRVAADKDRDFAVLIVTKVEESPLKTNATCIFEIFTRENPGNVSRGEIDAMKLKLGEDLDDDLRKIKMMVDAAVPVCTENKSEVYKKYFSVVYHEPAKRNLKKLSLECAKAALALYSEESDTPSGCQLIPAVYKPISKPDEENLTLKTCKIVQRNKTWTFKLKAMILALTNATEEEIEKEKVNFARDFQDMNSFMLACTVVTLE